MLLTGHAVRGEVDAVGVSDVALPCTAPGSVATVRFFLFYTWTSLHQFGSCGMAVKVSGPVHFLLVVHSSREV